MLLQMSAETNPPKSAATRAEPVGTSPRMNMETRSKSHETLVQVFCSPCVLRCWFKNTIVIIVIMIIVIILLLSYTEDDKTPENPFHYSSARSARSGRHHHPKTDAKATGALPTSRASSVARREARGGWSKKHRRVLGGQRTR